MASVGRPTWQKFRNRRRNSIVEAQSKYNHSEIYHIASKDEKRRNLTIIQFKFKTVIGWTASLSRLQQRQDRDISILRRIQSSVSR